MVDFHAILAASHRSHRQGSGWCGLGDDRHVAT